MANSFAPSGSYQGLTEPEVRMACVLLSSLGQNGLATVPLAGANGGWEVCVVDDAGHAVAAILRVNGRIRAINEDESLSVSVVYQGVPNAAAAVVMAFASQTSNRLH